MQGLSPEDRDALNNFSGLMPEDRDALNKFADSNPIPEEAWAGMHDLASALEMAVEETEQPKSKHVFASSYEEGNIQSVIEKHEKQGWVLKDQFVRKDNTETLGFDLFFEKKSSYKSYMNKKIQSEEE